MQINCLLYQNLGPLKASPQWWILMDAHIPPPLQRFASFFILFLPMWYLILLDGVCKKKEKDAFVPSLLPLMPCALFWGNYVTCKDILEGQKFHTDVAC